MPRERSPPNVSREWFDPRTGGGRIPFVAGETGEVRRFDPPFDFVDLKFGAGVGNDRVWVVRAR